MKTSTRFGAAIRSVAALFVQSASAHCDTEDGPAVQDGRRALEAGNVNIALKWVHPEGEDEVRASFDAAMANRARGGDGSAATDRQFLEALVRVHRAGEGAGFDGIKPTGAELPPEVEAADACVAAGNLEALRSLISEDRWSELERRFHVMQSKRDFDVDDLDAARDYVGAYVSFYKYAEGHDGDHHHAGHHHHH